MGALRVQVAVDTATVSIDRPYDYTVAAPLAQRVRAGARVLVPFGRGERLREAMVLSVREDAGTEGLKEVYALLDETPVLESGELKMALWLRERCFCTLYDAIRVILPHGVWYALRRVWSLTATPEEASAAAGRSRLKNSLVKLLEDAGGSMPEQDLKATLGGREFSSAVRELVREGVIALSTSAKRAVRDKTVLTAALAVAPEEAAAFAETMSKKAPAQAEAARVMAAAGSAAVRDLIRYTGSSSGAVKALEKRGIVTLEYRQVYRLPPIPQGYPVPEPVLNDMQQEAYQGMLDMLRSGKPAAALLQGVTGSGKTAIYIKLVKRALEEGKTAIVLVPEIALTPGLLSVFARHFGDAVTVTHSGLGDGERYDQWKKIKYTDEIKVVLGTRSAVFAPLRNLGLVVIDEEQESTYKSENTPCYHARDAAKYRCAASGALLVLGSATPSVETRYLAQTGRYSHFVLAERYNSRPLPRVIVADMKEELKAGEGGTMSRALRRELEKNLADGRQSILFINRRGNSTLKSCGECGHIHFCPNCSVAMTYHSSANRLMCHYCGHTEPMLDICPECGGRMKLVGAGTQKVEQEFRQLYPGVECLRMDTDTVWAKGSHDALLGRFDREKIPVLIGTQMITKGLNFANVTLVGVVAADLSLYTEDFRSYERTFSLITQVVGRAGRGEEPGRAVIQTFTPGNEVILRAASQDYEGFYADEINMRRVRNLPPYSDIIYVTASGRSQEDVFKACTAYRARLEQCLSVDYTDVEAQILGPAPLPVLMVNNIYRFRLTVLVKGTSRVLRLLSAILREIRSQRPFSRVALYADLD
ncbi:MAG: primosomal protein N' [Oscillospiraceae bacterium]|nr:primosomal protein N' [Oscillospiraceae bacterium]